MDPEQDGVEDEAADVPHTRSASRVEIIELLAKGDFAGLIGVQEDRHLDFKGSGQPYDLETAKGKRDLVADIAAFANAQGGIILLGVGTQLDPHHQIEFADEVSGVRQGVYTEKRVLDLVRAHCHPPVNDVEVRSYEGMGTRNRPVQLVAIVVEAQAEADSPVLVDRLVSDDGDKLGSAFGWPTRHGADTHWAHGSRVQQLVGIGLRPAASPGPTSNVTLAGESQLDLLDQEEGWNSWAVIALQMTPIGGHRIDDFYGSFREAINSWQAIRPLGFGRLLSFQPLVPRGNLLVSSGPRTTVVLSSDGVVTLAALGSPAYLGWAQHGNQADEDVTRVIINPYPLVEFVAEAVRMVYGAIAPHVGAAEWTVRVLGRHLHERVPVAVRLQPADPFFAEPREATTNEVDMTFAGSGNWDTDAFVALEALLGQGFGVSRAEVPFAVDGKVNPENFG
jgi:hypothetical protein